ncbi:MAG: MarR family winged helix-turn-helix transcriptional regulator [Coriobacteriaceae bacterium]|jgi:DNA-binding MarR family transcriptional regulator|nr:MarR family winged helix-turn-helix transcriptional regulator [Coriobacteriaceae bacterium]
MTDYSRAAVKMLQDMSKLYGSGVMEQISRYCTGESLILRWMTLQGGKAFPQDLGRLANISAARVAALLGSLEKKGFVFRRTDTSDRRRVIVTITEAGNERAEREIAAIYAHLEQIFSMMGEKDTEELIRLLDLFLQSFLATKTEDADESAVSSLPIGAAPASHPPAASQEPAASASHPPASHPPAAPEPAAPAHAAPAHAALAHAAPASFQEPAASLSRQLPQSDALISPLPCAPRPTKE